MSEREFPFTMGADPEFSFCAQGRAINAVSLLKDIVFKDRTEDNMGYNIGTAGNFGWDGCNSTGEMRPSPANTPGKLVDNIRTLITAFYDRIKIVDMVTDSKFAAIGGHIQFQINKCPNKLIPLRSNGDLDNTTLVDRRMRVMHNRLASFYLPLIQGDNTINLKLRKANGYGDIGDFRKERRENDIYTYEFRTPSAEWLTTPHIAKAMFAYLGVIYNEIINHPEKHKWGEIAIANMEQGQALFTLAMGKHKMFSDYFTDNIRKIIPSFEFYNDYKDDINFILNADKVKAEKEAVKYNIIEGWMGKSKMPSTKLLMNNKKLETISAKVNVEEMLPLIALPFNADLNVVNFVNEIKKRAICFGWKLTNQYYFFGTRKGIDEPIVFNLQGGILAGDKQIKTQCDHQTITETFARMIENFRNAANLHSISSMPKEISQKHILVGIPYTWRTNNNYRDFIKLMIDIDKRQNLQGVFINPELLVDDSGKNLEEVGAIARAYSNRVASEQSLRLNSDQSGTYNQIVAQEQQEAIDNDGTTISIESSPNRTEMFNPFEREPESPTYDEDGDDGDEETY